MSARAGEKAAFEIISRVLDGGEYYNLAAADVLTGRNCSPPERAAANAIARSVIENIVAVDYALSQVTDLKRCKKPVRTILRIGAARMLFTDMPKAKAASASVDIARAVGKGTQSGYVNAVMRKLAQTEITWPDDTPAHALAVRYSWPQWFCENMIADFGQPFAEAFLSYREHGPVSLRVNTRRTTRDDVLAKLEGAMPSRMDESGVLANLSDAANHELYVHGSISIQGEGSMLAAQQALCNGLVIDLCAAPGGKASYIAERSSGRVLACDKHAHRVQLVEAQARRLGLDNIETMVWDATQPLTQYESKADCVLVDAPCTGLGTALQRPDVKVNKTRGHCEKLCETQAQILHTAAALVKPGGRLVYCTCTPTRAENEETIDAFLHVHPFERDALDLPAGLEAQPDSSLRLWPQAHGTDAFYICRMVKHAL